MFWLTHKILSTAAAALWETTTTAAVDDGRRHRQGELLNMVRDGSGRVGATPVEDGGKGGHGNFPSFVGKARENGKVARNLLETC